MKKLLSFVLCGLLAVLTLAPVSAAYTETEKQYFEDGSYITVGFGYDEGDGDLAEGSEDTQPESGSLSFIERIISIFKKIIAYLFGKETEGTAPKTVSKTKYARYYDTNDNLLWSVYLTAEFSYDGENSSCTKVSVSADIKDSDWKLISSDCEKSGNKATGNFTVRQYKLGVPLKTIEKTLTLTCDKDGNVK